MFSFSEVYKCLSICNFYFKRLQKHYKDEAESIKKAQQKNKNKHPNFKK